MKNTRWTVLAALVMATPAFAQTQPGGPPMGAPMMGAPGAAVGGATADSGAITNGASTETTTTTTTSTEGIGPDGTALIVEPGMETTELANTGGEPIVMSLLGLSMAMGAFALRRRVSAN